MLSEGQQVELTIEKAVAGGRMLARHHGQIVLVSGAIPGERVRAWVERAEKRLAYAVTHEVMEASPDRRPAGDLLCGGSAYGHVAYPRQLRLKADVVADAFARLARHPLSEPIPVAGSPEEGYRLRARFHVRHGRPGFYREGTHQLCDPAATGQVTSAMMAAAATLSSLLEADIPGAAAELSLSENLAGDERAAHVDVASATAPSQTSLEAMARHAGLTGLSLMTAAGTRYVADDPAVSDPVALLAGVDATHRLRRHAASFFQANRFLLPALVRHVAATAATDGEVLDLYAGVGLFAVALAARGALEVTAVEADRASGVDLQDNARPFQPALRVQIGRVEDYLGGRRGGRPASVILDPPRTGLSKEALQAILDLASPRLLYVSCDPPTLARDVRRLIDAGYAVGAMRAYDLFPNTPHVEVVCALTRAT